MKTTMWMSCVLSLAASGSGGAIGGERAEPPQGAVPSVAEARRSVLFDVAEGGAIWVKGVTYKMCFDGDAARYIPVFGARAAKNHTLDMRFDRATLGGRELGFVAGSRPSLDGEQVVIDHGILTERWTFGVAHAEQDFVLPQPIRGGGDLRIQLAVSTDLEPRGRDSAGLRFEAADLGVVRYGDVRIVDARGREVTSPSIWTPGVVELVAPESFLRDAMYPVVIDPILETFAVDGIAGRDHRDPDVAYSSASNVWQVSYVEVVSASDHDVIARRFNSSFDLLDEIGVELSDDDTTSPSVAASSTHFLTAWMRSSGLIGTKAQGRFRTASSTAQTAKIDLTSSNYLHGNPKVAGPASSGDFLVVWTEKPAFQSFKLKSRTVAVNGTLGGNNTLNSNFSDATLPSVVKTAASDGRWVVAFVAVSGSSFDIHVAIVSSTGNKDALFAIDSSAGLDFAPSICGLGPDYLVVWDREINTTQRDIIGNRLVRTGTQLASVTGSVNLTALEPGVTATRDQSFPSVATDGCRFVYSYLDTTDSATTSGTNCVATLFWSVQPEFVEGHVALQTGTTTSAATVASTLGDSSGLGDNLAVFDEVSKGQDHDIRGVVYSSLGPSVPNQIAQTGCAVSGPEARVVVFGVPVVGKSLTIAAFDFHISSPMILVGDPIQGGACPGSTTCLRGVNPVTTIIGPVVSFTIPCEAALVGTQLAFQGLDVLPGFAFGACSPTLALPKFTAFTDTTTITLR